MFKAYKVSEGRLKAGLATATGLKALRWVASNGKPERLVINSQRQPRAWVDGKYV